MRQKARRKKIFIRILIAVLIIGLLGGGIYSLRYVKTQTAEVIGCEYITPGVITEILLPEEEDWNLLNILRLSLLRKPKIVGMKDVKVRPAGFQSVTITVQESEPYAWAPFGERFMILSEDGRLLTVKEEPMDGLSAITGIDPDIVRELEIPEGYEEAIRGALIYCRVLKEKDLVMAVQVAEDGSYFMEADGIRTILGDASFAKEKIETFCDLLPYFQNLSGTLHLEDYASDSASGKYTFEVGTGE